jgi:hypothetical protein
MIFFYNVRIWTLFVQTIPDFWGISRSKQVIFYNTFNNCLKAHMVWAFTSSINHGLVEERKNYTRILIINVSLRWEAKVWNQYIMHHFIQIILSYRRISALDPTRSKLNIACGNRWLQTTNKLPSTTLLQAPHLYSQAHEMHMMCQRGIVSWARLLAFCLMAMAAPLVK